MTPVNTNVVLMPAAKREKRKRRNRGEGGLEQIGKIWYYSYYDLRGKHIRRSSGSELKSVAIEELRKAKEKLAQGIEPPTKSLMYDQVREMLLDDYRAAGRLGERNGELTISGTTGKLKALDAYFKGMPVRFITDAVLKDYREKRKAEGLKGVSVNRDFAMLRRMLNLAVQRRKLAAKPCHFSMDAESAPRQGFVAEPQFRKLFKTMPAELRPLLLFLYRSGCRWGAAIQIDWSWVNLKDRVVAIPANITKTDKPITLPLGNELTKLLKASPTKTGRVFSTTNWKKRWIASCVATGLGRMKGKQWFEYEGLTAHDLRRSAITNLMQSGATTADAMSISGHKTVSVFLRYNIVDIKRTSSLLDRVERKAGR